VTALFVILHENTINACCVVLYWEKSHISCHHIEKYTVTTSLTHNCLTEGQAPCITNLGQVAPIKTSARQEPALSPAATKVLLLNMHVYVYSKIYATKTDACTIPSSEFVWQVLVCRSVVMTALSVIA
jgi:hypothetical protein